MSKFDKIVSKKIDDYSNLISSLTIDDFKKKLIVTNWSDSIRLMEILTKRHYRRFNVANLITIIGSVLVPVVINVSSDSSAKIISTILGVLVSISAALSQSYRFNDRWKLFRKISEELKIEGENFFALSGNYESYKDHENESFKLFMKNITL